MGERITDEMVERYCNAVNDHLGMLTPKDWEIERFDPAASIRRVARIGLTAALSSPAPAAGAVAWREDTPYGVGYRFAAELVNAGFGFCVPPQQVVTEDVFAHPANAGPDTAPAAGDAEVVAWQYRYICPEEGPSIWSGLDADNAELLRVKDNYETRGLCDARLLAEARAEERESFQKYVDANEARIAAEQRAAAMEAALLRHVSGDSDADTTLYGDTMALLAPTTTGEGKA